MAVAPLAEPAVGNRGHPEHDLLPQRRGSLRPDERADQSRRRRHDIGDGPEGVLPRQRALASSRMRGAIDWTGGLVSIIATPRRGAAPGPTLLEDDPLRDPRRPPWGRNSTAVRQPLHVGTPGRRPCRPPLDSINDAVRLGETGRGQLLRRHAPRPPDLHITSRTSAGLRDLLHLRDERGVHLRRVGELAAGSLVLTKTTGTIRPSADGRRGPILERPDIDDEHLVRSGLHISTACAAVT